MKYFISGGAGFVGSNLAKRLLVERGCEKIVIFDKYRNINNVLAIFKKNLL
jgi:nucleoside-diphosphate-sugar epimerase